MSPEDIKLPDIGDKAPFFEIMTEKGLVRFPEYSDGHWCVFFAHPANFTTCWAMFSTYLGMKERWLSTRNTKVLALSNEAMPSANDWSEKARRFIGIYMKAPVIEDLDFKIARMYGLASGRRPQQGLERLAVIVDPEGIIRMVINRPLPDISGALDEIALELDRLQGNSVSIQIHPIQFTEIEEKSDLVEGAYTTHPAHFPIKTFGAN